MELYESIETTRSKAIEVDGHKLEPQGMKSRDNFLANARLQQTWEILDWNFDATEIAPMVANAHNGKADTP